MSIDILLSVLGWCAIINMGLLIFWFLILVFAHDWVYRIHSKWFEIPVETFNSIHYAGMTFFKIAIFVLNVIPYFVLCFVV